MLRKRSGLINRVVCETLEARQYLDGLPTAASNVADITAITTHNAVISLDPTLQGPLQFPFANGQVKSELFQPDGKRIEVGYANGNWAMARYNPNSALDGAFGAGGTVTMDWGSSSDQALNVNLRPDGKIILMGLTNASGTWTFALARYNANGSLDTTFGDQGKLLTGQGRAPTYGCVAVILDDGRIHVTGYSNGRSKAMEWNADGKDGFDRLDRLAQPVHAEATIIATSEPSTGELQVEDSSASSSSGTTSAESTSNTASSGTQLLQANGLTPTDAGQVFTINIPAGKNRIVTWGDGSQSSVADDAATASHQYLSPGSYHPTASGYWTSLSAPASFFTTSDPSRKGGVLHTNGLAVANGDAIDLDNNDLIVDYSGASPFTTIQQWVDVGYSQGANPFKSGITSTSGQTAAANPILALVDNSLINSPVFPFGSSNSVSTNTVLGQYTYQGDLNLDGQITADDYGTLDANLGVSPAPGIAWVDGDTNYDGMVTGDDYGALDANFGNGVSSPLAADSSVNPQLALQQVDVTGTAIPPSPISIDGPQSAEAGDWIKLTADGAVDGSPTYIWTIDHDGKAFTSGEGKSFSFVATTTGTYTADVTLLLGSGRSTVASPVAILVRSPTVRQITLQGPDQPQLNHINTFTLWGFHLPDEESTPTVSFHWTAQHQSDNPVDLGDERFFVQFNPSVVGTWTIQCVISDKDQILYRGQKTVDVVEGATDPFKKKFDSSNAVISAVELPDGKIISFHTPYEMSDTPADVGFLEKLNPDLTVDTTWGNSGRVNVHLKDDDGNDITGFPVAWQTVSLQDDGKILLTTQTDFDSGCCAYVLRFNADGTLDSSFGVDGHAMFAPRVFSDVYTAALQPDGKLLVAGDGYAAWTDQQQHADPRYAFVVARLDTDGQLDTTFGNGGTDVIKVVADPQVYEGAFPPLEAVTTIKIQPVADRFGIILGGIASVHDPDAPPNELGTYTNSEFAMVRLNPDGSLDSSFGDQGRVLTNITNQPYSEAAITSIALTSTNDIVAIGLSGGDFGEVGSTLWSWGHTEFSLKDPVLSPVFAMEVAKYSPDGILDSTFGTNGVSVVSVSGTGAAFSGWVDAQDRIMLAGEDASGGVLARVTPQGAIDTTFGVGGYISVMENDATGWGASYLGGWTQAFPSKHAGDIILVGRAYGYLPEEVGAVARYTFTEPSVAKLTATARLDGPVDLQWLDTGSGEDGFIIKRALTEAGLANAPILGEVGANETTFTDTEVEPNTTYFYRVVPFVTTNGQLDSTNFPSADASATTVPVDTSYVLEETIPVLLKPPGGTLSASDAASVSSFVLEDNSTYLVRATGYFHLGAPGVFSTTEQIADAEYGFQNNEPHDTSPLGDTDYGISLVGIADNGANLTTISDSERKLNWGSPSTDPDHTFTTTYTGTGQRVAFYFQDDYYDDNSQGSYPQLEVQIYRALPSAPGNLVAEPDSSNRQITLRWNNQASDATGIVVERRLDNATGADDGFEEVAALPPDATEFTDSKDLLTNHKYTYRVRATNEFGESPNSNLAFTVLVNLPPLVDAIPPQTAHVGTPFTFTVDATDPEDGQAGLVYSLPAGNPAGLVFADPSKGELSGWTPDDSVTSQPITVRVTDQDGNYTDMPFVVNIAPDESTIPQVITGAYEIVAERTATTVKLKVVADDDNGEANLSYTWSVLARPSGPRPIFASTNGTHAASEILATLQASGTYRFRVTISDGTPYTTTSETTEIVISQQLTSIGITPSVTSLAAGGQQDFAATALDQFGRPMATQDVIDWSVDAANSTAGTINATGATGTYDAPATVDPLTNGDWPRNIVTASIESGGVTILQKQALVKLNGDNASPEITDMDGEATGYGRIRLTAIADDPDGQEADLTYTWTCTQKPADAAFDPTFASTNGTNAAKAIDVDCDENKPLNYSFQLTVRDKWGAIATDELILGDDRVFTSINLKPRNRQVTVSEGSTIRTTTFQATALDQYNRPMTYASPATPPDFLWKIVPEGIDPSIVTEQTGPTDGSFTFTAPSTPGAYTVYVRTSDSTTITATGTISVVAHLDPVYKITDPGPESMPGTPVEIDQSTDVSIIADDPNDDLNNSVNWYLWLRPSDGERALLASGTNQMGDAAGLGALAATLSPTSFADGLYTLELTASDAVNATVLDSRVVQLKSNFKLGGLTLPETDLQVDVPGGGSLTVTRVYDSMHAGDSQDFGYGWRLLLSDTSVKTTAHASDLGHDVGAPTFRNGDLVYITLPDGSQRVFQFIPRPTNYSAADSGGFYAAYVPQFVSVDGSNSILRVSGDVLSGEANWRQLIRDGDEFYDFLTDKGYNPVLFGNYTLITTDGTSYTIDASSQKVTSSTDANGNTTNYGDTVSANGMHIKIERDSNNLVSKVSVVDGGGSQIAGTAAVQYTYLNGELHTVTGQDGHVTTYSYAGPRPHLLTSAEDDRGVIILTAEYDPTSALLTRLTDASGKSAPLSTGTFDGSTTTQTVKDPQGAETEQRYNDRGDVIRTIQTQLDATGNITGYTVTVHDYTYADNAGVDMVDTGKSMVNLLEDEVEYQPVHITGNDPTGSRFSLTPTQVAQRTDYIADPNDSGFGLPASQTTLDANGVERTTTYGSYVKGKPEVVKDGFGNYTYSNYDDAGNLLWTLHALGEGTAYVYSDGGSITYPGDETATDLSNLRKGLVLETFSVHGTLNADPNQLPTIDTQDKWVLQSFNRYYANGNLESTTNASGLTTEYTYTTAGQTEDVIRAWNDGSSHIATDSHTSYDPAGRVHQVTDANGNITTTNYNEIGKAEETIDSYGGSTLSTYNATGNLIRTLYPDGTETRTSYDAMGRVEWATDRYKTTTTYDAVAKSYVNDNETPALATHTIYDTFGRVIGTERYQNVLIAIQSDSVGNGVLKSVAPAGVANADRLSTTSSTYDGAGHVVETTDASGLRTGTVYYANGQVNYTGALVWSAPALWYTATDPSVYFAVQDGHILRTSYAYDLTAANLPAGAVMPDGAITFDKVTDALGHITETFKDAIGRAIQTTYDDGTFTQTLSGIANLPVAGHDPSNPSSKMPGQTLSGHQEIKVDQLGLSTDYFYDPAGRLVDVWLPAVMDADPSSLTYNTMVRPHWHYEYDANGSEIEQVDPKGNVTSFTYDDNGNRTSRTLPGGKSESFTYDSFGREQTHVDFDGQTTGYVYDNTPAHGGRLLDEYRYDDSHAPTFAGDGTLQNPNDASEKTEYQYDNLGRQDVVTDSTNTPGTSSWSASTYTDTSYDPVTGNVDSITTPEGVIHYAYDPATGLHTETWTDNNDTGYGYDNQERLQTVTVTKLNGSSVDLTTTYTYDAVGNLLAETAPNGVTTSYTYDDLNRLTHEVVAQGSRSIFEQTYTLADDRQRTQVIEKRWNGTGSTFSTTRISWSYDGEDRLTQETCDVGDNGQSDDGDYVASYSFDLNGNRIQKMVDKPGTSDDETLAYSYDSRDRLTSIDSTNNANDATYDYDDNGSTISVTTGDVTHLYVWDLRNRAVGYDANGDGDLADNGDATYTYDTSGNRVGEQVVGETPVFYLMDPENPTGYAKAIQESDTLGGTPTLSYVIGLDVVGQSDGTAVGTQYLMHDGHGTTRALTDSSGATTEAYDFDAYGNLLRFVDGGGNALSGNPSTVWLMPDGYRDFATHLDHNGARDVAGYLGRMWSMDPYMGMIQDPQSLHKYLYCEDDPRNRMDASGFFSPAEGRLIHLAIEGMYEADPTHLGHRVFPEQSIPTSGGLLIPDITDYTLGEIAEIKPLTTYGMATGPAQLGVYLLGLNGGTVKWRGKTYTLPPTPNTAGKPWTPSTWPVGVRLVPVTLPNQYVFTVGNAGGIIYYTSLESTAFSLQQATELVKKMAEERDVYKGLVTAPAGDPAGDAIREQIDFSLHFSIDQHVLSNLAISAATATMAGMLAMVGISTLNSVLADA